MRVVLEFELGEVRDALRALGGGFGDALSRMVNDARKKKRGGR